MSVIRPTLSRFAAWLVGAGLLVAAVLLKVWLAATTSLTVVLEAWGQRVQSRRAAVSLAAARNARAADRWRTAFEAAPLGMAKVNPDGRLDDINSAFRALLGEPERAILGRRLTTFVYPDDLAALSGPGNPGTSVKGVAKAEVRLVCAGGQLRWCEVASSLVRDTHGRPEYVLVTAVDITRHKRSQAALRDLATRDPLSGLANRRWFELQLAQHLRLCADEGPRGALFIVDLDYFKLVNDSLGHQAGDRLIVDVASTLRRHLRDQDVVARLGGDEFAVVVREGDRFAAEAVARKLVIAVRDEVHLGPGAAGELDALSGRSDRSAPTDDDVDLVSEERTGLAGDGRSGGASVPVGRPGVDLGMAGSADMSEAIDHGYGGVTVSVGVAAFELLGATADLGAGTAARDALRAADAAMYEVKRSGRNGYAVAGSDDGPRHARRRSGSLPDLSVGEAAGDVAGETVGAAGSEVGSQVGGGRVTASRRS